MLYMFWSKIYDPLTEKEVDTCGIISGENFTDAMKKFESYYGNDFYNVRIEQLGPDGLIEFPKDSEKFANNIIESIVW